MANQKIKANLIPSYDMINPVIHLAQYDVSDGTGKQVEIELYYGSDKYTIPSGSTVTFRGTKRDKTGYSYEITKFTDNVVTVDVKPQMTVLSGTHNAELRITNGHTISNTIKFVMDIESSALADDTKVSETQLPTIEKASQAYDFVVSVQDKVEEAKASAESAITSANEASTSATTASEKATEASTSATKAKASETNASNSAKQAQTSADSVANVVSDVSQLKEDIEKDVLDLSNKTDAVEIKNEDNGYKINNIQTSVFGNKKNTALTPYHENEDGKYYNAKGEIVSSGNAYSNIYKIDDVENISIYNYAGGNLPLYCFFDINGRFLDGSSFTPSTGWTGSYITAEIPNNAYYIGVNGSDSRNNIRVKGDCFEDSYKIREELERLENSIPNTSNLSYDISNLQNQLAKTQRMNDFDYNPFDKAYFVLTIDDANMYLPVVYDLCHELGIKLCPAIIPSKLNTIHTTANGRTVKQICDLVVADGGEILSHSGKYIKADSTDADYEDVFRETKKVLEENGYNIRGIITAGGAGYSSFTRKLDDWSRRYYDYSDQNGLRTSPAYSKSRWWHHDYTMAQCKSYVDNAVTNKTFTVMAMHGTDDTSDLEYIDHLRELLEYMIAKGTDKLEFVTWAYVYDTFGTTKLEKRIKALENA